ncbi:MAG TPA: c-type cytochrome [Candidatus Udaeobacter sp.]|jgi:cytochrome c oxidase cbb3-type subunit 3|nr:c-type cytochrome [Candidatus Udaeobacter sp.]
MQSATVRRMALALLLGVAALAVPASRMHGQPSRTTTLPANIARGQRVFLQYCAMCHGDAGQGDGELAPQLRERAGVRVANLTDRVEIARLGRAGIHNTVALGGAHAGKSNLMPAWRERLSRQELEDVVDYVARLPDLSPGITSTTLRAYQETPPGEPAVGRSIFLHQCSVCHGLGARGDGPLAASLVAKQHVRPRNLTDSTYLATRSDRDLFAVITQGGGATGKSNFMPHWGGYLTAEQIKDLVSYVRVISRTAPRP